MAGGHAAHSVVQDRPRSSPAAVDVHGFWQVKAVGVGWSAVTALKPYRYRFPMGVIGYAIWLYH